MSWIRVEKRVLGKALEMNGADKVKATLKS